MEREILIRSFARQRGWGDVEVRNLAGDASNRRYLRLRLRDRTSVLMDAPPADGEDVRPFIAMTEWLRENGLSAPEIIASDPNNGFLLLEDLGDNLFARHLSSRPQDDATLYGAAIHALIHLHQIPAPTCIGSSVRLGLQPYDLSVLHREAELFTKWYLPAAAGPVSADTAAEYDASITKVTGPVQSARNVVVLRDYHAENLIWRPDQSGLSRVGLLDYQDALAGHRAYDLVSLLEDARRDTSAELQEAMLSLYLKETSANAAEFRQAYALLGAQRNLKIIGIFARLALRDKMPAYLSLIPRVWAHLQRDLSHPDLVELKDWLACHAPHPEPSVLSALRAQVPA